MQASGVNGPLFISIGDEKKLSKFLELNQAIPPENAFVDDYSFGAYEAAGFKSFTDTDPDEAKKVSMSAPDLSMAQWWSYMTNVGGLSPIPSDMKFGDIPEGVLRLGGTFVISRDNVIFAWADKIPGDHPALGDVLDSVESAVAALAETEKDPLENAKKSAEELFSRFTFARA